MTAGVSLLFVFVSKPVLVPAQYGLFYLTDRIIKNMGAKHENAAAIRDLLASALGQRVPISSDLEADHGFVTPPESPDGMVSYMELLVMQMVHKACAGSDKAITEVLDRLAGKPTQVTENLHATVSYEAYLQSLADEEPSPPKLIEVRDELEELFR